MAPEQVMGHEVDRRCDIYAMGVLTFEMLTGRLPFIGSNRMEVAYATVNAPVPSAAKLNNALPDELDELLAKVLAKDPAQRPQTVQGPAGADGEAAAAAAGARGCGRRALRAPGGGAAGRDGGDADRLGAVSASAPCTARRRHHRRARDPARVRRRR